jgi:4-hydroxy-tetrahydrodipicolinate synthase
MPAVLTPFGDDGRVRPDILSEMVAWYVDCGVDGIVGIGTLGEHRSLDADERRTVIAAIVEGTGGRVPVTIGVSAETARDAAVHAVDAARSGAQAVMCLPPLTYHADAEEMVAFYAEVASATDLPLMVYNHPIGGLDDLTPEVLARLVEIDHVAAVKESSGEVRRIAAAIEATGGEMEVVAGTDDIALEAHAAGATGWVTGVGDVAPAECVELWRLLEAGKVAEAQALWLRLLPLARLDTHPKLVQFYKASLDEIGKYGGPSRPPRLPLNAAEHQLVVEALDRLWGRGRAGGSAPREATPVSAGDRAG